MKRKWWILPVALLAVFGLLFTGCPSDGGGGDNNKNTKDDGTKDDGTKDEGTKDGVVSITAVRAEGDSAKITVTEIANGIKVEGGNYDYCYPVFTVALGGKKLSEFTSVKFTVETKGGDLKYKPVGVLASGSNITGQLTEFADGNYTGPGGRVVAKETGNAFGADFGKFTKTLTIDKTAANTATSNKTDTIYLVILIGNNGSAGTEYEITDISFQ
jgi:hypothetical protein